MPAGLRERTRLRKLQVKCGGVSARTPEFINHPDGQHAFDIFDDDERSRSIVRRTLAFLQEHLLEKR